MNLTSEQFIDGLERCVQRLPAMLAKWHELDADLREEYASQIAWMLSVKDSVLNTIGDQADRSRYFALVQRVRDIQEQINQNISQKEPY